VEITHAQHPLTAEFLIFSHADDAPPKLPYLVMHENFHIPFSADFVYEVATVRLRSKRMVGRYLFEARDSI
jgi:hypothetical protein